MLEHPSIPHYRKRGDNVLGADNQQERSKGNLWNPQRLYAEHLRKQMMIQSGLHGDMQRLAEMSSPSTQVGSNKARAKFLVG